MSNDHNSAGVTFAASGGGTLSNTTTTSATFTAPAATNSAQTITVTATSIADTSKTGTVTITVPAAPSITSTSASLSGSVGTAYSVNLQASGGIPPYTWSVASGSTLPAGLTLSSSGQLTGTPPASAAGTTNVTFTAKDSGTPTAMTVSTPLAITVAAAPAISFVGTMPPSVNVSTSYNGSAHATGGAGALTYSLVSGALPTGATLNASTGAVTGTLTAVGTFTFKIGAADSFGDAGSSTYTVTVSYPAMSITTGSTLTTGYVNGNYTQILAATGGTNLAANYSWALTGGSVLPAGLNLSAAGVISGKPTGPTGTTSFTAQVTDTVANLSTTAAFSITVNAGVSITTTSPLANGYVGSNYSVQLGAVGGTGTGYTWSLTSGSSLPAGLALSNGGLISGRPTTAGGSSFSVTVTDSASNTASQTFSITISAGVSITSSNTLPTGYQGAAYPGATFTATGGTGTGYTWTWAPAPGSSLPAGLLLSPAGAVSGTPTSSGAFSIVVTVTDSASNTTSATVSLTVEATLSISPSTLPSGTVNVAYSQTLTASGGSGTGYTWASLANTNPGLGITLSTSGVISGTATSAGSTTITAQVTDSESHSTTASLTVNIYSALTVSTTTLQGANVGIAYSQTLSAGGGTGTGYTWTALSSNLSSYGLSLSSAGVVSGTPTTTGTASFTAKVTDSGNNTATQALTIQVYAGLSLPAANSLPNGYVGVAYSTSISPSSGGSGNYCWTVTGLPSDNISAPLPNAPCGYVAPSLPLSGTPNTATSVTFSVQLTDTSTGNSITQGFFITINTPTAPSLPGSNPSAATVNQAYSQSITATGGVGPNYTWTVNGTTVPTTGSVALGASGLSSQFNVSTSGNSSLSINGNPTSTGTVNFTAQVKDNATGLTSSTQSYSIQVNQNGSNVTGQIYLDNVCGGSLSLPTFSVTIQSNTTSYSQTVSTDASGNYSFTGLPNDTYTITPSITGPHSAFHPATYGSVVVNNANLTGENFQASLGYNIAGQVSYGGAHIGQVYLYLHNTQCGGNNNGGTSITYATLHTGGGNYSITGVPPGTYTLYAWMDPTDLNLGYGSINVADPQGSTGTGAVTVAASNTLSVNGINVTLTDPSQSAPTTVPNIKAIAPMDQGAVVSYGKGSVTNNGGAQIFTQYTVQWSTSTTGFSSSQQATFNVTGGNANVWILSNGISGMTGSLSNTGYYFRVMGSNPAGNGPWGYWNGSNSNSCTTASCAASVLIGAPTAGNSVSGSVTLPSTIVPNGSLYVGYYDANRNYAYATKIAAPSNTSPNAYTVNVPNGSTYIFFAEVDQNNDGQIDVPDITNVNNQNNNLVTISGNMTNQNLTLSGASSTAFVQTSYIQSTSSGGSSSSYFLSLGVNAGVKQPVSVTLTSGPHLVNTIDLNNCACGGQQQYSYNASIESDTPALTDNYVFTVNYSDGSQDTAVSASPLAFGSTGAVTGPSDVATSLSPTANSSTSTTPTFTWTDPANASDYYYGFYIQDNNGNLLWQIPSQNSNANGFPSTYTSITWGTDPTDGTNTPTVPSLTLNSTYYWTIIVQDANGNQASTTTWYQP